MAIWIELRCEVCMDSGHGLLFESTRGAATILRREAKLQGWSRRKIESQRILADVCRQCRKRPAPTDESLPAGKRIVACEKCGEPPKAAFTVTSHGLFCEKCAKAYDFA